MSARQYQLCDELRNLVGSAVSEHEKDRQCDAEQQSMCCHLHVRLLRWVGVSSSRRRPGSLPLARARSSGRRGSAESGGPVGSHARARSGCAHVQSGRGVVRLVGERVVHADHAPVQVQTVQLLLRTRRGSLFLHVPEDTHSRQKTKDNEMVSDGMDACVPFTLSILCLVCAFVLT